MSTKLIENRQRGASLEGLTNQQRMFVLELLASNTFSPGEAAKLAGYKHPNQSAWRLLKNPRIAAALGKAQREREERCELKGDDVLNFLREAIFFNPLHYFRPTEDGGWLITDPDALPEWVGRLIEKMRMKITEYDDGSRTSRFEVELVSKTTAIGLAMKHIFPDKLQAEVEHKLRFALDDLYEPSNGEEVDPVEQRIIDVEHKSGS